VHVIGHIGGGATGGEVGVVAQNHPHPFAGHRLGIHALLFETRQGDVVKVPYPYTDRSTRQSRPALVVSLPTLETDHGLLWVVMITSAENRGWPGDVTIDDLTLAGLPAPSVIRPTKIATIDAKDAQGLGAITDSQLQQALRHIGSCLVATK
jgi:mRNA interferase MazF